MTGNDIKAVVNSYTKIARNDFSGAILVGASDMIAIHDLINRQKAEIERLEKENRDIVYAYNIHITKPINHIKAEAVKEFAERLKERFLSLEYGANTTRKTLPIAFVKDQIKWIMHEVSVETIDNLVKEMVGETNEQK